MRLDRKRKKIIFAMILGICVIMIGSKVFGKYHSEQKAINRLIENPFLGSIRKSICKVEIIKVIRRRWL